MITKTNIWKKEVEKQWIARDMRRKICKEFLQIQFYILWNVERRSCVALFFLFVITKNITFQDTVNKSINFV